MGKMNESNIDNRVYISKKKMASKMPTKKYSKLQEKKDHFGMTSKQSSDYQRKIGRAYND